MRQLLLYIIMFAFFFSLGSCNTFDPGYERDNKRDPGSDKFLPSNPEGLSITVIEEDINLNWRDISEYEDGYIIEKSLNEEPEYFKIAELLSNTTSYTDSSRITSLHTKYKVTSFINQEGKIKRDLGHIKQLQADFINLASFSYDDHESVRIEWKLNPNFTDGLIVERKSTSDTTYVQIVKTDNTNTLTDDLIDIDAFEVTYRLSSYINEADSLLKNTSETKTISVHSPKISSVSFMAENETIIKWDDRSKFESGFILEKATRRGHFENFSSFKNIANLKPNQTTYKDTSRLQSGNYYKYRITATFGNSKSSSSEIRSERFFIPKPELNASGTNNSSIKLNWNKTSDLIQGFIIERRTENTDFQRIAEVDKNTRSFIDNSTDIGESYIYRIKSLSSEYSNPINLQFYAGYSIDESKTLTQNEDFANPETPTLQLLDDNKIAIYSGFIDYQNNFYNSVYVLSRADLSINRKFNSGKSYLSSYLSSDGKNLLQMVDGDFNKFNLNLYDFNNGTLLKVIQDVHTNDTHIVTEGSAYFNYEHSLAASFINRDNNVKVWDATSGTLEQELAYKKFSVRYIKFHPSKNILAVSHVDGLDLWDLSRNKKVLNLQLSDQQNFLNAIEYSKSENKLYYTSQKKLIVISLNNFKITDTVDLIETPYMISLNEKRNQISLLFEQRHDEIVHILDLKSFDLIQKIKIESSDHPAFIFDDNGESAFSVRKTDRYSMHISKWLIKEDWYSIKQYD